MRNLLKTLSQLSEYNRLVKFYGTTIANNWWDEVVKQNKSMKLYRKTEIDEEFEEIGSGSIKQLQTNIKSRIGVLCGNNAEGKWNDAGTRFNGFYKDTVTGNTLNFCYEIRADVIKNEEITT